MFLVNWLASSSLFERIGGVPQVDVAPATSAFEKSLTREEELNSNDRKKMTKIRHMWSKVASELGLDADQQVKFAFQSGGAETSVAVWHKGSPTIVIPFSYLSQMVLDGEDKQATANFDRKEWDIWSKFIDNSPDQVSDMFSYAEGFKKNFSAKKLRRLASRYGTYLNQLEFEAELAHEFGHIQARHLNPCKGRRLTKILRSLAGIVLPVAVTAVATFCSFILREFTGGLDLALPVLCGLFSGACVKAFFSDRVLRKSVNYVRRQWEREADAIAAEAPRFCEGNVRLYKKDILVSIIEGESVDVVSRRIFEDAEHHPSDGSRLRFFLSRLEQHNSPAAEQVIQN